MDFFKEIILFFGTNLTPEKKSAISFVVNGRKWSENGLVFKANGNYSTLFMLN